MMDNPTSSKTLRFLRCQLGDATYCLNMTQVRAIQRVDQLQRQSDDRDRGAGQTPSLSVVHLVTPA
jgi:hypothetical protein